MSKRLHMPLSVYPLLGLCLIVLFSVPALAEMNIVTQTFNIPLAPCEGLAVAGVTYSFTVAGTPNLDCMAGTIAGPGVTNNISSPNIEGTAAGVLHLTFDVPTTKFGFGVAQSVGPAPRTVVIDLYRPGVGLLRDEVPLVQTPDPLFVGGRYDYDGPAIKTVTIRFAQDPYSRFAVDNVTYFRPPGLTK